jgi:hypothetical protein
MITEYIVSNVCDLLEAADAASLNMNDKPIFRGHRTANPSWRLLPKAFRDSYGPEYERVCAHQFRREAIQRHPRHPNHDDLAGWLVLMQHYHLPTRLLDWSFSPLVAAFFAVEQGDIGGDGIVWCLGPSALNMREAEVNGIMSLENPATQSIVADAFDDVKVRTAAIMVQLTRQGTILDQDAFRAQWNRLAEAEQKESDKIYAVYSSEIDPRIMMQQGLFTLHSSKTPLDGRDGIESCLVKCTIPSESKQRLAKQLETLGTCESMLFPDLDALARDITARVGSMIRDRASAISRADTYEPTSK